MGAGSSIGCLMILNETKLVEIAQSTCAERETQVDLIDSQQQQLQAHIKQLKAKTMQVEAEIAQMKAENQRLEACKESLKQQAAAKP